MTQTQSEGNQSPGVKASVQMRESQGQSVASTGQILGRQKSQFGFGAQQREFWCSGDKIRAWLISKKTPHGASQNGLCWLPKELKAVFVGEF